MQANSVHAQSKSIFTGQPSLLRTHKPQTQIRAQDVRQAPRKFRVYAKIDTGYKVRNDHSSSALSVLRISPLAI
jgi:hypothetical protein